MSSYSTSPPPTLSFAVRVLVFILLASALITFVPVGLAFPTYTWIYNSLLSIVPESSLFTSWGLYGGSSGDSGVGGQGSDGDDGKRQRVNLEIHIMSKCPDARDCIEDLVFPALKELGPEMVEFRMSFIGKKTAENGGVACMHGPGECLGNMVHLCGAKLYPYSHAAEKQNTTFIPFSQCLVHDYKSLPDQEFIEHCAKQGKVDFQKINECISDQGFEGGIELLKSSVAWSEYLGVRTSCTVRLAGQRRCVRDGGRWRECEGGSRVEDLVRDVKKLYYRDEVEVEEDVVIEPSNEGYGEFWQSWLDSQK